MSGGKLYTLQMLLLVGGGGGYKQLMVIITTKPAGNATNTPKDGFTVSL